MILITIPGKGDPNGEAFQTATETLYALSYSIKMSNKAILEYVVAPLEGLWWAGALDHDKSAFEWIIMLRQPDFVTPEIFEAAKTAVAKKKPQLDLSAAHLEKWTEGLCVQACHIGTYDTEAVTIDAMKEFAAESGYGFEDSVTDEKVLSRRHHEIYHGDPRKTAPEKLKTLIRHPVGRKEES
jgi:hypothetical protein